MTNLKKLGLSALAGSLVAVSAQAGEIAVTGSANVTYVTGEKVNGGKTIGTDRDVAFTGTGELDNGWTFTVSTLLTDAYCSIFILHITNYGFIRNSFFRN